MNKIVITIEEYPEDAKILRLGISGIKIGKYMATVEYENLMTRLFCEEDARFPDKETLESIIYSQTQMLQIHDKIKFHLLAIADGRIQSNDY